MGVNPEIWVTQFFQGIVSGDSAGISRYGGKFDGFLTLTPEKFHIFPGLQIDAQYEHYFGLNINPYSNTGLPVNTAQAYLQRDLYHSALSLTITQKFNENLSITAGKFNMMSFSSQTPLVGGGGINSFMNRAFALPSTGVSYTSVKGGPEDRVVLAAPYSLGARVALQIDPFTVDFVIDDPRSAIDNRVIEHPFAEGVALSGSITLVTRIGDLRSYHTLGGSYSNARGVNLHNIESFNVNSLEFSSPQTKKGSWVTSYAFQQYLFQRSDDPEVGWGLFALGTLTDGNPSPIKWTVYSGIGGNNIYKERGNDRWGIGFYHFGASELLISGLAQIGYQRQSEGGVEAFYNFALTPQSFLSADIQVIQPWNSTKQREQIVALRLQTKF